MSTESVHDQQESMSVNFNELNAWELRLNLFDDVEMVAVRDRVVKSGGARVWVGYIPDADVARSS
jgi:hypothetical protein